jgi:hypothetical protein
LRGYPLELARGAIRKRGNYSFPLEYPDPLIQIKPLQRHVFRGDSDIYGILLEAVVCGV